MRIERLSDTRIRVTLTTADLVGLDINIEQLRPDSKELHSFLFNIMETIKEETDFNPYNGQVVVEAMPSSEGISIVVSKIYENRQGITPGRLKKIKSVTPHIKKAAAEVFYFECMDDLCGALAVLDEDALLNSSLYRLDGRYYYVIKNVNRLYKSLGILFEYASCKSGHLLRESFIKEHGQLIAEKESLLNMANGIKTLK